MEACQFLRSPGSENRLDGPAIWHTLDREACDGREPQGIREISVLNRPQPAEFPQASLRVFLLAKDTMMKTSWMNPPPETARPPAGCPLAYAEPNSLSVDIASEL